MGQTRKARIVQFPVTPEIKLREIERDYDRLIKELGEAKRNLAREEELYQKMVRLWIPADR
ncbi:MAG TPA: hypothetical protein PLR20_16050 [Syntrophales bacterium]|nr:hypothetical protein [Syntrophales bacterium]